MTMSTEDRETILSLTAMALIMAGMTGTVFAIAGTCVLLFGDPTPGIWRFTVGAVILLAVAAVGLHIFLRVALRDVPARDTE